MKKKCERNLRISRVTKRLGKLARRKRTQSGSLCSKRWSRIHHSPLTSSTTSSTKSCPFSKQTRATTTSGTWRTPTAKACLRVLPTGSLKPFPTTFSGISRNPKCLRSKSTWTHTTPSESTLTLLSSKWGTTKSLWTEDTRNLTSETTSLSTEDTDHIFETLRAYG